MTFFAPNWRFSSSCGSSWLGSNASVPLSTACKDLVGSADGTVAFSRGAALRASDASRASISSRDSSLTLVLLPPFFFFFLLDLDLGAGAAIPAPSSSATSSWGKRKGTYGCKGRGTRDRLCGGGRIWRGRRVDLRYITRHRLQLLELLLLPLLPTLQSAAHGQEASRPTLIFDGHDPMAPYDAGQARGASHGRSPGHTGTSSTMHACIRGACI